LADKSTQLIIEALTRAAAEPSGLSLYANKSEGGLFPSTAVARNAADRAKADGLLRVVESDLQGRAGRDVCALTEKGREFLIRQASPRQVLEDLVRVLEERRSAIDGLAETANAMSAQLQSLRTLVEQVIPRLSDHPGKNGAIMNGLLIPTRPSATAAPDTLIVDIRERLAEWHAAAGASQDCPLPDLYRKLESTGKASVGQFHDGLRQLHDDHQIYLHPWTGPLYALPEPAFALLVGHEVAYYASIR
jgi:DNA-binding PadR family transcriptional regulator